MSGASGSVRLISPPWPVWRTEPCAGTWKVRPARKVDGMLGAASGAIRMTVLVGQPDLDPSVRFLSGSVQEAVATAL